MQEKQKINLVVDFLKPALPFKQLFLGNYPLLLSYFLKNGTPADKFTTV